MSVTNVGSILACNIGPMSMINVDSTLACNVGPILSFGYYVDVGVTLQPVLGRRWPDTGPTKIVHRLFFFFNSNIIHLILYSKLINIACNYFYFCCKNLISQHIENKIYYATKYIIFGTELVSTICYYGKQAHSKQLNKRKFTMQENHQR